MQRKLKTLPLVFLVAVLPLAGAKDKDKTQVPPTRLAEGLVLAPCDAPAAAAAGQMPSFRSDTACLESRVRLEHVSGPHTFRFLWYDPDGNLYTSTKKDWSFAPAEGKTGYHRTANVRHRVSIKGEQAAFLAGEWKVMAEMDGLYLAEAPFRLEAPASPLPPALQEARKLYLDLQYDRALETLQGFSAAGQPSALQAQTRWWTALAQNALGRSDEARATLAELVSAEPTWSVSPAEAKAAGGEELRLALEELRRREHADLYVKTAYPPQVELSGAEEAPVLSKRWPFWKKALVYGGAPVVVGVGVLLLAGGGKDGPAPLEMTARIVESRDDPGFECVPLNGLGTVTRTFEAEVSGGSGNYGIAWDFNRGGETGTAAPATATDVARQQVRFVIGNTSDFGSYLITVEATDKDAPALPGVRETLVLLISLPARCER